MSNTEQQQVLEIIQGDTNALRTLFTKLEPQLMRYMLKRVDNPKDAEELVQDTLLSFLDALPLFRFQSSLWTFLVSIARHEVTDYWRKKYAKKAIKAMPLLGDFYNQALHSSSETAAELHGVIDGVYAKLQPAHVQLLRWKYEDGFKIQDMAKKLALSVKATESQLFRARKAFKEMYVQLYGEPEFSVVSVKK